MSLLNNTVTNYFKTIYWAVFRPSKIRKQRITAYELGLNIGKDEKIKN